MKKPPRLEKKVLAALGGRCGVVPGETGLLCVSGGADSLALLHLIYTLRAELRLKLEVLHFDHGLRESSGEEARRVAGEAAELGLPCHVRSSSHLSGLKHGLQAAARSWRRRESRALMAELGAGWIATGHQRDDQIETIILKLLRGCHLSHLRGMDWRSGGFIRPLLEISHQELKDYLGEKGLKWLEDPSNQAGYYKRNRVRSELRPLLDELAEGNIAAHLETLQRQAGLLEELLGSYPAPPWNDPADPPHWMEIGARPQPHLLPRGELLHRFIRERLPGELNWSHIEKALELIDGGGNSWELHLPGGRLLRRRGARLLLSTRPEKAVESRELTFGGWRISAPPLLELRLQPGAGEQQGGMVIHGLPENGRLEIRTRAPGDRFHPPWRRRPVKVKDFLRDQGIPLWERDLLPLVLLDGRVIAIYPRFPARGHDAPQADGEQLWLEILQP